MNNEKNIKGKEQWLINVHICKSPYLQVIVAISVSSIGMLEGRLSLDWPFSLIALVNDLKATGIYDSEPIFEMIYHHFL